MKIRVDGPLAFNNIFNILEAALSGFGLAYARGRDRSSPSWRKDASNACWRACPYWDGYDLIIRAVASPRPPSSRWSTHYAIATDGLPTRSGGAIMQESNADAA